jgi:hypothetical protein
MICPPPDQHDVAKGERMARLCLIADTLYWKASEDGLTFSFEGEAPDDTIECLTHATAFKAGFRIGLGYRIPHDRWEVKAYVTQLRDYTQWEKNADDIHPTFDPSYTYGEMKESWHLKYTLLDLEVARRTPVGKAFGINPFFGLRAARINQLVHLQFAEPQDSSPPLKVEGKNDYHAYVGPRLGLELDWHLARCLALFGRASGSFLFGHFDVDMKVKVDDFPDYTLFSNEKHPSGFSPNLELAGGMKGTIPLYQKKAFLTLGVDYEFSEWFFQNALPTVFTASGPWPWSSTAKRRTLSFQGVTFLTRLDF